MAKDKAELMRESRARKTDKLVKCEVYLPRRGLNAKKLKLAEFVEGIGGKYKPKLD
jgi:hypothetical protein